MKAPLDVSEDAASLLLVRKCLGDGAVLQFADRVLIDEAFVLICVCSLNTYGKDSCETVEKLGTDSSFFS